MGYEFRGHAYLEAGQYQAAINDFTKAIDLDSQAIYGWRMRGRAYYFLNQFDNAMSDYRAALRIDPQDNSTNTFINELRRKRR
jgi:Tfp pilus assembly protein PilF